jgi:hypothetical protein
MAPFPCAATAPWSSGMIPPLGGGGLGFDSPRGPVVYAPIAQSVERGANNAAVEGSSPSGSTVIFCGTKAGRFGRDTIMGRRI